MSAHALLSPSGASRWLNCTPSARLESTFPDRAGQAAAEGTLAHKLGELLTLQKLDRIQGFKFNQEYQAITLEHLFDNEMLEHSENYSAFIMERFNHARSHTTDAQIFLEQKLDLTAFIPEGFGTADAIIIANDTLDFIDLKYGKGVPVAAEENKQLMVYALGALHEFEHLYSIQQVCMTIYQPRIDNISSYSISVAALKKWASDVLVPKAKQAFEGEGEFKPGAHCQFCRAKAVCRANYDEQLKLAKYEFQDPALLTDEEIADVLDRSALFTSWVGSVNDYALAEAKQGKKWPGYKVVAGRSNRVITDPDAAGSNLIGAGFVEEKIYTKKLLPIGKLEKEVGKKAFTEHVDPYVIKPAGAPALVPLSDKRPELNSAEAAAEAFADIE